MEHHKHYIYSDKLIISFQIIRTIIYHSYEMMLISSDVKTMVIHSTLITCEMNITVQNYFEKGICYFHECRHCCITWTLLRLPWTGQMAAHHPVTHVHKLIWYLFKLPPLHTFLKCKNWEAKLYLKDSVVAQILQVVRLLRQDAFCMRHCSDWIIWGEAGGRQACAFAGLDHSINMWLWS